MIPDILTSCHINWRIAQRSIVIINPLIPCRSISSSNRDMDVRPMPWRPWRPPRGWSEFVPWKHTLNRISHLSEAESYFCSFFPPNTRHGANQCRACWLRSEVCSGSPLVISTFDFYSCYKWAIKSGYNPLILTNLILTSLRSHPAVKRWLHRALPNHQGLFAGRFIYINRTAQGELFGSDRNSNAFWLPGKISWHPW